MKSLLGVLLLCFVCMAKGADPCIRGEEAISVFMNMRNCEPDMGDQEDFMGPFIRNATADNFRSAISGYCSQMMPAMRDCFRQNIQNCSADRRAVLTRVLEDTGFLCQPNSDNVHPHVAHLLTHFSDADFEEDDNCVSDTSPYSMHRQCANEILAAMGFISFQEFRQFLENATVEELMPYVSVFLNTFFECVTTTIRDLPNRCGHWRGQVIYMLRWNLIPTILGRTMTFTTEQLDEMFEFQDTEESGAGQSAQSILSKAFFLRP